VAAASHSKSLDGSGRREAARLCHQRLAASSTAVSWNSGVALIISGQKSRLGLQPLADDAGARYFMSRSARASVTMNLRRVGSICAIASNTATPSSVAAHSWQRHSTDAVSQKAFGRAIDFPHQSPEPKRPARLISAR